MRRLAIFCAALGIFTLAACAPQAADVTPTLNPTPDATDNANTSSDTSDANLNQQETNFTASITGDLPGDETEINFDALGRWVCQPPVTTTDGGSTSGGETVDIPGVIEISGLAEQFVLIALHLPFDATPGEYQIDPLAGQGSYSALVTLRPEEPNENFRAVSGTITIEALPELVGERAAGSFEIVAQAPNDDEVRANGQFDFIADETSVMCTRSDPN
jgi:hypothetical protein